MNHTTLTFASLAILLSCGAPSSDDPKQSQSVDSNAIGSPFGECGDGNLNPGEECDDGAISTACDADCTVAECGDGTLNELAGEACDDAGESEACDTDCTPAECGDGLLNELAGEACDDAGESEACDTDCTPAECGDGLLNTTAGETCDESGESETCDIDCTPAECGDGWTNTTAGEDCDDAGESEACDTDCTPAECGDGWMNTTAGEDCDDAGDSAACDTDCTPAECGDGWTNTTAGEDCDEAGESEECDVDCTPAECGDGWMNITAGEDCDDAGESADCDTDCTAAECGDALVNSSAGETCDDGGESTSCDADCTLASCGDGWINTTAGEHCDDAGESETCDTDCTLASCGDGWINITAGEHCDDAGESEACDIDCTAVVCGDGTLNTTAGEECDPPDDDETCLLECIRRVGNCHTDTPWHEIADSLYDHDLDGHLPSLPGDTLVHDWDSPTPEFLAHRIEPEERFASDEIDLEGCETPVHWDPDVVQIGTYATPADEDEAPYCRIRLSGHRVTDPSLYFANRARDANSVPITGEPTWIRMRFPIPEGHKATSLTYTVNWSRLFGSHPDECTGDDVDEDGTCIRDALEESEIWDEEIPPGLFLLWGRATDCDGWEITGPHEPAGTFSWSGTEDFTVDVPDTLDSVDELVVSMLVYHQYPGSCVDEYCAAGKYVHANLGFSGAKLMTEQAFDPPAHPTLEHPRLFGDNTTWLSTNAAFDALPCSGEPDWSEGSTWGGLTNIRNTWDKYTKGGAVCLGEVPETLYDIDEAAEYLDGTAAESFDVTRATRMLHLIRHERACSTSDLATCYHDEEEVEDLAAALIAIEMARIRDAPWSSYPWGFDLWTREPMRVYTLLADILWDDLTEEQHAELLDVTGEMVDTYLENFYVPHWSIYNGNNWTPVLAEGAMYWAITYYHEDERAPELAWRALQTLWLHRDMYLDDGVYAEGLMMYSQVSFDPLMAVSRLADHAFHLRLDSIPWERMDGFSAWTLAFMGIDGKTVDFADAWAKRGWPTFMPLIAHMVDESTGTVTADPDPCFAHRFFSNKYYYHGMADPWNAHPALAKDWPTILSSCSETSDIAPDGVELRSWDDGGWGSVRVGRPGATEIAASDDSVGPSRFQQADQVMLAISAIPNSRPHTEMDFGSIVWLAYGNRLIWDIGYGSLHRDRYETAPDYPHDQNPTGHSTLIIPEALRDGDPSTNTSQIDGRDGTIETVTIDGHQTLLLDGSIVYGRDDPEYGWLEHFHRRVVPLDSGHMVLIDDFTVRSDREDAMVSEYWYTMPWDEDYDSSTCKHQDQLVHVTVTDDVMELVPLCSGLENTLAESAGRIVGTGLHPGRFEDLGEISMIDRLEDLNTKRRISWRPDEPVRRDLRLFALLAAPGAGSLPEGEWSWVTCDSDMCAQLSMDGEASIQLGFDNDGTRYSLSSITTD